MVQSDSHGAAFKNEETTGKDCLTRLIGQSQDRHLVGKASANILGS